MISSDKLTQTTETTHHQVARWIGERLARPCAHRYLTGDADVPLPTEMQSPALTERCAGGVGGLGWGLRWGLGGPRADGGAGLAQAGQLHSLTLSAPQPNTTGNS